MLGLRRIFRNRARERTAAGIYDLISAIDCKIIAHQPLHEIAASLDAAREPLLGYLRDIPGSPVAAKALTLKILNLLLAKYELLTRRTTLLSRPYGLLVDPSNGCNLACPGCVHSTTVKALKIFDWNKGLLSEARFRQLLESYGTFAFQILFCNYGEPITNPNTPRLIEIAKGYLAQTVVSTSLSVARFDAEAYVRSGLDFLILSIDGATQKVYERYRKNGNIEIVYRNIENLVRAKRALKKRTPVIRWQFLAFQHNVHEIPLALNTAKALGVDQFTADPPFDVSWDDPSIQASEISPINVELDSGTEEKLSQNYFVHFDEIAVDTIEREFEASWSDQLKCEQPPSTSPHTCHWLYKNMVMDANGRILPCCASPRQDVQLVFSTLNHERPEDHFNSELYQEARQFFADKASYQTVRGPYCVDCEWEQLKTDIGPAQIAQALRTFGKGLLNPQTIPILANW
jgi:MoaA/NifB/PqqE/SkfB family radical SAM enzyme